MDLSAFPPLLGGFWLVLRSQALYLVSLQFGQGLVVLLSALVGFGATLVARLVITLLVTAGLQSHLEPIAKAIWPFPYAGTAIGAFLIAVAFAEGLNLLRRTRMINAWVINHFCAENIKLLYASMLAIRPVSLTMDSRKIYIGFVQGIPSLDPAKAFVRLLPVLSGYRHPENLTFNFTTEYAPVIQSAEAAGDYIIVLPLSGVKSINLFDIESYRKNFGPPDKPLVIRGRA
jgi:hypothetical protein